jgi:hypothetical protein
MKTPPKILNLVDVQQVSVDRLINDIYLQRDIYYTLHNSTRRINDVTSDIRYNPNPVVILIGPNEESKQRYAFRIDDQNHIYLFQEKSPVDSLHEEENDTILSGICIKGIDQPFDKGLYRVRIIGGTPFGFDKKKQVWKLYSDKNHILSPLIKTEIVPGGSNTFTSQL